VPGTMPWRRAKSSSASTVIMCFVHARYRCQSGFKRSAYVAFIKIYAACRFSETSHIFERLTVFSLGCLRFGSWHSFAACSGDHSTSRDFTYSWTEIPDFEVSSLIRPKMQISPGTWSLARLSLVQNTLFWASVPACGLLAACKGMAADTITVANVDA
jgi:hypothetical protein